MWNIWTKHEPKINVTPHTPIAFNYRIQSSSLIISNKYFNCERHLWSPYKNVLNFKTKWKNILLQFKHKQYVYWIQFDNTCYSSL